eukprot:TRINITY_DN4779_c0_g1_i5.p1 TRINITY_DN4779_c0_g1~~TRINITY_DN4779_c0_g1_i5.p1  ORF type:complete len:470 (+),score=93.17 TRINITY_DN4779_c0_g1_i5:729-2138(+)
MRSKNKIHVGRKGTRGQSTRTVRRWTCNHNNNFRDSSGGGGDHVTSKKSYSSTYGDSNDYVKDWSKEFQKRLREVDEEQKYAALSRLSRDFLYVAETYGRIIISELFLPFGVKTIQPRARMGVAGGSKYICQGILFKLTLDVHFPSNHTWLYGGTKQNDEKAMKAACNELKGLTAFFQAGIEGLCFPLIELIHYRGFCLLAISILPLGENSILYGSNNGGLTVHADDPFVNDLMKSAGIAMNLRGHVIQGKEIYGPGDIEVHIGKNPLYGEIEGVPENSYYVLDFARVLPPEGPVPQVERPGNKVFYDLLRANYVRTYVKRFKDGQMQPCSLCSDSFSGWLKDEPNTNQINSDTLWASLVLYDNRIPYVAQKLATKYETKKKEYDKFGLVGIPIEGGELVAYIHKKGINCRHLGWVRMCLEQMKEPVLVPLVDIILTEWGERYLKNLVRKKKKKKKKKVLCVDTTASRF